MNLATPQAYDATTPVITNATLETKSVLSLIRNTNRKVLIGSQGDWEVIQQLSGKKPVIYGFEYQNGQTYLTPVIKAAYDEGAIITLCDHMPNFYTWAGMGTYSHLVGSNPQTNNCYDKSQNTMTQCLPGGSVNATFLSYLDTVCSWINSLVGSDGKKIPILYRPAHECNGDWFWWHNRTGAAQYVQFFQYIIDRFRTNGVTNVNVVWCPTVNTSGGTPLYYADINPYFPGGTYCDIVGLDIYSNAVGGSYRHSWVRSGYTATEQISGENNKPMSLAETGFQDSAWNWNSTPEGFWDTVIWGQLKAEMPAVRYVMFWNSNFAPGMTKTTTQSAMNMLNDPISILR